MLCSLIETIHLLRTPLGHLLRALLNTLNCRHLMQCFSSRPLTVVEGTKDPSDSHCDYYTDNNACYLTATKAAA